VEVLRNNQWSGGDAEGNDERLSVSTARPPHLGRLARQDAVILSFKRGFHPFVVSTVRRNATK